MSQLSAKSIKNRVMRVAATAVAVVVFFGGVAHTASAATYAIPEVAGRAAQSVQAPSDVRVVDRKAHTVSLAWFSDIRTMAGSFGLACIAPTTYTVNVYTAKGVLVSSVQTSQTQAAVKGLEKGRLYTFSVTAARGGFVSEASEVTVRTLK